MSASGEINRTENGPPKSQEQKPNNMNTNRSIFNSIDQSELKFEKLEPFTEKAKLINAYLTEALEIENLVSPIDLLDEFDKVLQHIEQLASSTDNITNDLIKISQKKVDVFDEMRYQIGPGMVELHNRLFPVPDPKERHHILKIAVYLTKYDSIENREFIIEIKKIHDVHFKVPLKRK